MMVFKSNKKKSCTKNDGEVRKKASKKKQTKTTVGTSTTFKSKSRFKVRRNYSQEAVKQAVQAVQGGTSLRQAAKNYGVTESNEDSKEMNNFTEVHPTHPTTNEIPSLRNDQENSNYIANQADQTSKLTSNFQKVFPIEHLAEKKRKKAISSKTPRLPSAGCSDAWIENKMKKFQDQQQKEKEKLERQRIMEEKKKLADEKKKLNQQITELQKKLKKEKK